MTTDFDSFDESSASVFEESPSRSARNLGYMDVITDLDKVIPIIIVHSNPRTGPLFRHQEQVFETGIPDVVRDSWLMDPFGYPGYIYENAPTDLLADNMNWTFRNTDLTFLNEVLQRSQTSQWDRVGHVRPNWAVIFVDIVYDYFIGLASPESGGFSNPVYSQQNYTAGGPLQVGMPPSFPIPFHYITVPLVLKAVPTSTYRWFNPQFNYDRTFTERITLYERNKDWHTLAWNAFGSGEIQNWSVVGEAPDRPVFVRYLSPGYPAASFSGLGQRRNLFWVDEWRKTGNSAREWENWVFTSSNTAHLDLVRFLQQQRYPNQGVTTTGRYVFTDPSFGLRWIREVALEIESHLPPQ